MRVVPFLTLISLTLGCDDATAPGGYVEPGDAISDVGADIAPLADAAPCVCEPQPCEPRPCVERCPVDHYLTIFEDLIGTLSHIEGFIPEDARLSTLACDEIVEKIELLAKRIKSHF